MNLKDLALSIKHMQLGEDFILNYRKLVNMADIAKYQILSENTIRELQDENVFFWAAISHYQKLSEEFILEFEDRVSWGAICSYQKLSDQFLLEYVPIKIYYKQLLTNPNISDEIKMLIRMERL